MTLRCTICCCTGFAILSGDYTVTAWRSIILFTWFKPCNNIGWFRYCRTWQKCKITTENGISVVWYTQLRIFHIQKSHHFCGSLLLITLETSSFYSLTCHVINSVVGLTQNSEWPLTWKSQNCTVVTENGKKTEETKTSFCRPTKHWIMSFTFLLW